MKQHGWDTKCYYESHMQPKLTNQLQRMRSGTRPEPAKTVQRRTRRPHQKRAVNAILKALQTATRTKAIMACGTGKSLVGLWAAHDLSPMTVLVLVPTVALIKQVRDEWVSQSAPKDWKSQMQTLCVCSDDSVVDGEAWDASELGIAVSTASEDVTDFLLAADGEGAVAVIFSTYASASVVAAGLKKLPRRLRRIDVGVFDEAHKTVGAEGKAFAFALHDANLPIAKRIFFTATPRIIEREKGAVAADYRVSSMDDETIYGATAITMSFKEAVEAGLILPYKLIISVIDDSKLTSDDIDAAGYSQLANQHIVREAMDAYGLKKALTFHSTVDAAERFASTFSQVPGAKQIELFHVSGRQTMAERDRAMKGFIDAGRAILTNSRCLTEGVDIPAIDMVAFMDRRRSKIDIVQAICRGVRTAPGKTHGYVLLPIHVNLRQGESIESALERAQMGPVIDVITALFENDADMQRAFVTALTQQASQSRKDKLLALDQVGERDVETSPKSDQQQATVYLGASVDSYLDFHAPSAMDKRLREKLFEALKTRVLRDALGGFYETVAEYAAYLEQHGQGPTQHHGSAEDKRLAHWATRMRRTLTKDDTADARVRALNDIGFDWQGRRASPKWERQLELLAAFLKQHGQAPKTTGRRPNEHALYEWLSRQRRLQQAKKLDVKREAALREVMGGHFVEKTLWDRRWDSAFDSYAAFVKKNKRVPTGAKTSSQEEKTLAQWSTQQGTERRAGNLKPERLQRLLTIPGFPWSKYDIEESQRRHQLSQAGDAKAKPVAVPVQAKLTMPKRRYTPAKSPVPAKAVATKSVSTKGNQATKATAGSVATSSRGAGQPKKTSGAKVMQMPSPSKKTPRGRKHARQLKLAA